MVMLCFVLDLRTLSPPLLRDLKQSLLQLANFYAISSPKSRKSISNVKTKMLLDKIGLCYVFRNRISCSTEMKVAYRPTRNFSLRDFHHAVNNLPTDAYLPELNNHVAISCCDALLTNVLNDKVLYSWGGDSEDVGRKLIVISSRLLENLDSVTKKTLMDAADKCVSVDFLLLASGGVVDPESVNNFMKNICDLENCSFHNHLPDAKVLCTLVKQWLHDLRDEAEQLQARLKFKKNVLGSLNQIFCNLFPSFSRIIDEFEPCQACRCHGYLLDDENGSKTVKSCSCPVSGDELGSFDLIANSLKVGQHTVLLMPSFHHYTKLQHVSTPIDFNIIYRTNLASLSEGLIVGAPFVITPSTSHESDDTDQMELNNQVFQGLCRCLHTLDQGLVCSSRCNTETMMETPFQCYYILLPSDNGVMLLRRLAASEEVIPVPDVSQSFESTEAKDIRDSIKSSLLEIEVKGYNPILHERGFHQRLNVLVKESLHFGSLPTKSEESFPEPTPTKENSLTNSGPSNQKMTILPSANETPHFDTAKSGQDKITARITEEWEQLIVNELPKINSPTCVISKPKDQFTLTQLENNKPLDEKTSRILERLEVPRKLKPKISTSPIISSAPVEPCLLTKKPLIPFQSTQNQSSDTGTVVTQPMRPNFQRLKRKNR